MNRSTCTICSDLLTLTDVAACPCGHTFHYQCLLAWKERSATCPQCRLRFNIPIKLFFDIPVSEESDVDVSALKNQLNDLKMNLILKEQDCTKMREKQLSYESEITVKKQELQTMSELLQNTQGHNSILKKQILYLEKFKSDCEKSKAEVVLLEKKLSSFGNISELVKGDRHEVEAILKNYTDSSESLSQIKTSYIILKNAFDKLQETKNKLEIEKRKCKRRAEVLERERCEQNEKLETLNKDVIHLNAINKKLMGKVQNLECSFNFPSPCIASSKRTFTESSEPVIKKRSRLYEKDDSNATLDLFDNSSELTEKSFDIKSDKEIEELFGLKRVATTNIADHRVPLRDIKSIKYNIKTQTQPISSCGPLMRQGFNGMGGQSRLLVLPKKSSSAIAKTAATIRNVSCKLSKNKSRDTLKETKISDFLGSPITISP